MKAQLLTLDQAAEHVTCGNIDAALYDGKRYLTTVKLLSGALTIQHNGMIFERIEHRSPMGKKVATTRRNAVKFKRMEAEKEAEEIEYRRKSRELAYIKYMPRY